MHQVFLSTWGRCQAQQDAALGSAAEVGVLAPVAQDEAHAAVEQLPAERGIAKSH